MDGQSDQHKIKSLFSGMLPMFPKETRRQSVIAVQKTLMNKVGRCVLNNGTPTSTHTRAQQTFSFFAVIKKKIYKKKRTALSW